MVASIDATSPDRYSRANLLASSNSNQSLIQMTITKNKPGNQLVPIGRNSDRYKTGSTYQGMVPRFFQSTNEALEEMGPKYQRIDSRLAINKDEGRGVSRM